MSVTSDLSLGEFRALVAKAFRGAGYSWGLTEDASFSAKRLAEYGVPAADLVADLLTTVDGNDPKSLLPPDLEVADSAVVCPIWVGVCIADHGLDGADAERSVTNVAAPSLIGPIAATCLPPDERSTVVIEWDGGRCEASTSSVVVTGRNPDRVVDVHISRSNITVEQASWHDRVVLQPDVHAALEGFAQRTYAPATEASRLAGAGPS